MKVLLLFPMADGQTGPGIKYAFEQLGHEVKAVDAKLAKVSESYRYCCEFKPDLVFCSRTQQLTEDVASIKKWFKTTKICVYNVDTRVNIYEWKHLFPLIKMCDYYFVPASGLISEWRKINPNTFWLPQGLQIERHDKPKVITEEDKAKYSCDVCWIGHCRGRHHRFRGVYLDAVEQMGVKFKQWACRGSPLVWGAEHNKAVALARINIALSMHPQNGKYTSERNYMILGAGGFLMELAREELYEIFPRNILDSFKSPQELVEKISWWLAHEKERREYAEKGYKWVRENATWAHRIKTALDYMGLQ